MDDNHRGLPGGGDAELNLEGCQPEERELRYCEAGKELQQTQKQVKTCVWVMAS